MNKFSTLTIIAGLITAVTTLAPSAAVITTPRRAPTEEASTTCIYDLAFMRVVRREEIQAIGGDQRVALIPVCEEDFYTNDYGTLFVDGNAAGLRHPIARNALLMGVLGADGYDEDDVVSIRFGADDSVLLYVHQRQMR